MDNNENVPPMVNFDSNYRVPGAITPNQRTAEDLKNLVSDEAQRPIPHPATMIPTNPINPKDVKSNNTVEDEAPASFTPIPEELKTPPKPSAPLPKEIMQAQKTEKMSSSESIGLGEALVEVKDNEEKQDYKEDIAKAPETEKNNAPVEDEEMDAPEETLAPQTTEADKISHDSSNSGEGNTAPTSGGVEQSEEGSAEGESNINPDVKEPAIDAALISEGIAGDGAYSQAIKANDNKFKIVNGPKEFRDDEIPALLEETTSHYRIIEGLETKKMQNLLNAKNIDTSNVSYVDFASDPQFIMNSEKNDMYTSTGTRKVQVVCVQSGYSCMAIPLTVAEFRSFNREIRSEGTYNYYMNVYRTIFNKLTEFSCGAMTFDQWLKNTIYSDVETLIFGLYMATFPGKNPYNFYCDKCGKQFSFFVDNKTLLQVNPGNVWTKEVNSVLYRGVDPKTLVQPSNARKMIRIALRNGFYIFDVVNPTIDRFLTNAYKGKTEDAIENDSMNSYYQGYIAQVGVLDLDTFSRTGETRWFKYSEPRDVARYIAKLTPDEYSEFSAKINSFINKHSVEYQVPAVKCPSCKHIITQKSISMWSLFFDTKRLKGL